MSKQGPSSCCELCNNPARMFCESDQARLCWDCDEKVHSANFLVAKHSRTLLCHVCCSHTAWKASGLKLGHTVCVCHGCAEVGVGGTQGVCENSQESESDDGEFCESESDEEMEEEVEEEEEEDDGENQVVPWADAAVSGCCSDDDDEEDDDDDEDVALKRIRQSEDEDDGCCSSENSDYKLRSESDQMRYLQLDNNVTSSSTSLLRPLKIRRTGDLGSSDPVEVKSLTGTAAIVDKLRRLQQGMVTGEGEGAASAAMILGICKLTRDDEDDV